MKNYIDLKKVMQWLGYILKCPICGQKYHLDHTKIVDSRQNEIFEEALILIHSECQKCKSSVMFNIEIRGPELFSSAMITDLTHQDTAKFKKHNPISPNEVIKIHQSLKQFKGDLVKSLTSSL